MINNKVHRRGAKPYRVKFRYRYLAVIAISAGNILPRNYRTKVSRYNEFYRGIAQPC